jgi:hypothetical protein
MPVLVVTLIALALPLIPLAWALARRVRRTQDGVRSTPRLRCGHRRPLARGICLRPMDTRY